VTGRWVHTTIMTGTGRDFPPSPSALRGRAPFASDQRTCGPSGSESVHRKLGCNPTTTQLQEMSSWLTHGMVAPLPEPDPMIDPNEPVPNDPAELLPDAPKPLPPAPIESTPDDPGGDTAGVPEPA